MQLPFKYEDLLNNDSGLETISTTVREVNKKVTKDKNNSIFSSIEDTINSMVDWSDSECLSDDILNSLLEDCGMFSQTFFDDIEAELDLGNTYDSLFADTIPYHGHWTGPPINKDVLIKSHDCMWAGHCGSSEHKDDCDKALHKLWAGFMNPPKVPIAPVPLQSSQQSLLKPSLRNAGVPVINMITPQTPPMSDDEDKNSNKTQVESGSSSDIDEADQELREYFSSKLDTFGGPQGNDEGSSESSSEASESENESHNQAGPSRAMSNVTSVKSNVQATQNDHSYFKDKNSSMIMSDLGIDTPSDSGGSTPPRCESVKSVSEEEIDVVSVPDKKYPVANRIGYIPPTNPPYRGRRNMQRPSDSAIISGRRNNNNNNNNTNNRNGVKIMLPAKRAPPAINYPPAKRRAVAPANDNNKGRRTRQTRTNMSTSRRRSNNNQEVEGGLPDLEKRDIHNNMERQRREDLRDAFDDLRLLVPEVLRKDRAAKVVILREAAKYCSYLTNMARSMKQHRRDVRVYQKKLKRKLSYLRRKAAIENGIIGEDDDYEEEGEDYENDEDDVEED